MTLRKAIAAVILIAALLLPLGACSAVRGRTDRFDGYTVRTEKAAAVPAPETSRTVPERGTGEDAEALDYVLNKSSMKFHDPSCPGAAEIKEKNRWDFHGTRQSVVDMGYAPCKICNP